MTIPDLTSTDFEQMGLDIEPAIESDHEMAVEPLISEAKSLVSNLKTYVTPALADADQLQEASVKIQDKASNLMATIKDKSLEPMEYFDFYSDDKMISDSNNQNNNNYNNNNNNNYSLISEPQQATVFEDNFNKPVNTTTVDYANKQQHQYSKNKSS